MWWDFELKLKCTEIFCGSKNICYSVIYNILLIVFPTCEIWIGTLIPIQGILQGSIPMCLERRVCGCIFEIPLYIYTITPRYISKGKNEVYRIEQCKRVIFFFMMVTNNQMLYFFVYNICLHKYWMILIKQVNNYTNPNQTSLFEHKYVNKLVYSFLWKENKLYIRMIGITKNALTRDYCIINRK